MPSSEIRTWRSAVVSFSRSGLRFPWGISPSTDLACLEEKVVRRDFESLRSRLEMSESLPVVPIFACQAVEIVAKQNLKAGASPRVWLTRIRAAVQRSWIGHLPLKLNSQFAPNWTGEDSHGPTDVPENRGEELRVFEV